MAEPNRGRFALKKMNHNGMPQGRLMVGGQYRKRAESSKNPEHREGVAARTIEQQTAKLPSMSSFVGSGHQHS